MEACSLCWVSTWCAALWSKPPRWYHYQRVLNDLHRIRRSRDRINLAALPPPPPPSVSKLGRRRTGRLRKRDNLPTGEGEWDVQESLILYKSFNTLCHYPSLVHHLIRALFSDFFLFFFYFDSSLVVLQSPYYTVKLSVETHRCCSEKCPLRCQFEILTLS